MAEYILGLDRGQASDYSALCVLEKNEGPVGPDGKATGVYGCPGLKRWQLGTAYPTIVAELAPLVEKPPLGGAHLVLGATVVGRPVVDLFR